MTDYLLPTSVDDWLTQDPLARFAVEIIDGLDLSHLTRVNMQAVAPRPTTR